MRINKIDSQSFINLYKINSKTNVQKNTKAEAKDTIEISSLGQSLKDYSNTNYIDNSKKIEQLRAEISKGTYNVNAELTARSMINYMKGSNV